MSLWSMTDNAAGVPKSISTGNGNGTPLAQNAQVAYQNVTVNVAQQGVAVGVFGVDTFEKANTGGAGEGPKTTHAGWVQRKVGTGYVASLTITNGGAGMTPGPGFITFTGGGAGSGANALIQVNAAGSVANVTINVQSGLSAGMGASYNVAPTANTLLANSTPATFVVNMGGRVGRREYITLVAAGSLSRDANTDDAVFGG